MAEPPVRKQPGIPMWVWILVLIAIIVAIWWIFDSMNEPEVLEEPTVEMDEAGDVGALGPASWVDAAGAAAPDGRTWSAGGAQPALLPAA
ncbi:MAG TPA: hypothetical protein VHQ65_00075 [Thermoanaerobaculia bacterium]|nr:hypothetical protein [Thermoanaerobaculia bacterium]